MILLDTTTVCSLPIKGKFSPVKVQKFPYFSNKLLVSQNKERHEEKIRFGYSAVFSCKYIHRIE